MACSAYNTFQLSAFIRQVVSQAATAVRCGIQPRSWRQRCSEDNGNYRRRTLHRWIHDQIRHAGKLGKTALAHYLVGTRRDRSGNVFRRLAHCAHHGTEDHETKTDWRFLRGERRSHHALRHRACWNSRKYNPHHHRCNRRCRSGATLVCCSMGNCWQNRLGLDAYDSSLCHHCGPNVLFNALLPWLIPRSLDPISKQARRANSESLPRQGKPLAARREKRLS